MASTTQVRLLVGTFLIFLRMLAWGIPHSPSGDSPKTGVFGTVSCSIISVFDPGAGFNKKRVMEIGIGFPKTSRFPFLDPNHYLHFELRFVQFVHMLKRLNLRDAFAHFHHWLCLDNFAWANLLLRADAERVFLCLTQSHTQYAPIRNPSYWAFNFVPPPPPKKYKRSVANECISRESNPGHIDGNDVFCH